MPNIVISNILNGHRHLNMYRIIVNFYCKVEYLILGMFLILTKKKHYRKVIMGLYNQDFHIRPLVTHFLECISKSFQ